jgi:hypothetical protein
MTIPAKTSQRGPIPAGSPCFRAVWNGRHELMIPADAADQRSRTRAIGSIGTMVRRGIPAPVLPGRAAIGVLGAASRTQAPGLAG